MSDKSSDETVSYSEEEVVDFEMDVDPEPTDVAMATILEESEELEKKSENNNMGNGSQSSGKGKQKMPRLRINMVPETKTNEADLWKALEKIQNDLVTLRKRNREEDQGDNENHKRAKISTATDSKAFDRPQSSKTFRENELPRNSNSSSKKQLSSATVKHSGTAIKKNQLSSEKSTQQLSSVQKQPHAVLQNQSDIEEADSNDDEELTLEVGNLGNDPLLQEQAALQAIDEASSDDDEEDGILDEMATAIDIRGDDEFPGAPLALTWAEKINLAWKTKVSKATLNLLSRKYPTPSNLTEMKVPRMNKEIWRLIGKWQRKSDLSLSATQRYLMKAATAVLKLQDYIPNNPRSVKQVAMQTAADVITMMGRVNQEIVGKRKTMVRPCLKGDFKTLSTSTEVTENLFGDNLTQDIKDVQVKRKLENANSYGTYGRQYGSYQNRRGGYRSNNSWYGSGHQNSSSSFLWRGRSRGRNYQQRAPHYQSQNNGPRDHLKKN